MVIARGLDRLGRAEEAAQHWRDALEIAPAVLTDAERAAVARAAFRLGEHERVVALSTDAGREPVTVEARGILGLSLAYLERDAEAIGHLDAAMPEIEAGGSDYLIYGIALARMDRLEDAVRAFKTAIGLDAELLPARRSLAFGLERLERFADAVPHFELVVAGEPENVELRERFAGVLARAGRTADAAREFRAVVATDPDRASSVFNLAWLLSTDPSEEVRDGAEAVRLVERMRTARSSAQTLDLLGMAYAESGRFDDAIRVSEEAIALARSNGQPGPGLDRFVNTIERRIAGYRRGEPMRSGGQ